MKTSAGLLMFRRGPDKGLEILLVHPGGPFFRNKDGGAWTIPKGEAAPDENLIDRARTEFEEELGFSPPAGTCLDLGHIKQKGGKTVYCWAFEGDLPRGFTLKSNTFEIEWPPRSGQRQSFPEIDRAEFFPVTVAQQKINPAQRVFIERLLDQWAL